MSFYSFIRPLIFQLDPEKAHNLAIDILRFCPKAATLLTLNREYENLKTKLWDIDFKNPIGMAAGFDKNAQTALTLEKFGFGFIECGTVTPKAQKGNPTPRIFRLAKDEAIINRLGFNNLGADIFAENIANTLPKLSTPLGINIGKNKDTQDALKDYLPLLERFYQDASYITLNISSPNTQNLRDLQKEDHLSLFLSEIMQKKRELMTKTQKNTPILLKVAPDLTIGEQEVIAAIALKNDIDGMIISNTTIDRDLSLKSPSVFETGGLSGKPLRAKSNEILRNFYQFTEKKIPLIGVGGISSAEDAYERIKSGASLVQIYSAFIYQGFGLVEDVKKGLSQKLEADGFANIRDAVGVGN